MRRLLPLAALVAAGLATAVPASAQLGAPPPRIDEPNGGLAAAYLLPREGLEETHDHGWGIHLLFAYGVTIHTDLSGTIGWNRLLARTQPSNAPRGSDDLVVWEFTLGPRFRVAWFYAGVEGGYFTRFGEWGWVPNAGIRWKILDLGYRLKSGGDAQMHTVRLGVFF